MSGKDMVNIGQDLCVKVEMIDFVKKQIEETGYVSIRSIQKEFKIGLILACKIVDFVDDSFFEGGEG